jgi:hypothetical protein
MGGGIVGRTPEIAPARDHGAVAHDHRTEREVCLPGLVDRHAHEAQIRGGWRIVGLRERGRGHYRGAREARDERSPGLMNIAGRAVVVVDHVMISLG